ncbi:ATP-dependent RNA helicase HrpA [Microcella frigidaquae]|uniref:ATP-dependent helicase HrpA n=1 Tax=Microcella frigidaquae TaxID=424758 RepID=A0A840XNM6_9MICO|nr:ATP-dependent RNA helicase HrpA [Microcella frigidaquae]MBB5617519.1 ATP-dependent helicase HrpA [Microcella frigidaquae]NHN45388.1 ATP-dependent RNA helicase HrpA [Microcella frigidaquae]
MTAPDDRPAPRIPGLAITYPPDLPVSQRRDDIAAAIAANQVVIVAGETGSGKTTQLPKILLELGRESIAHTQPRRIAARTIAERVADELGSELGGLVGYKVRFTDQVSAGTRVTLMTDGILLAALRGDRELRAYDAIIIDEAHERSLTIDFLIGYLKQLLPRRPELKVVITSATIDPESFARHFSAADGTPAPIIEVSGRTYPVEIRYRPLVPDGADTDNPRADQSSDPDSDDDGPATPGAAIDMVDGVIAAVDELGREGDGDVLVFFSGENEIRDAADALRGHLARQGPRGAATEVLPLYGRLSAAEQHRVFERPPAGIRRRIVLATNVAETSLTVPGIRYVVDTGTARISRYSTRSKVQQLPIEPISQASANQRSGRSGRTSDGIAIRLYSEADFERRPAYTEPEILRTNLAAVILQMIALGLGDIERFPFLQPPDKRGVADGLELLRELGALEPGRGDLRITKTGRAIAQLPLDPRYARMVVEAQKLGVVREVVAIVAGLSIQDPRERPADRRETADQLHNRFRDPTSDFITLLNLWRHLQKRQTELSGNQFRKEVRAEFLNYLRVREWADVERQVLRLLPKEHRPKGASLKDGLPESSDAEAIHRALLSGLLSHIGLRDDREAPTGTTQKGARGKDAKGDTRPARGREFLGARGRRFVVYPGSGLAKKPPAAVMAAELVETSRLFARTVAAIDPAWAEALAGDLAKKQYSEPRWQKSQGSAVVDEKVTLYGVPIVPRRRVQLSRIDAPLARELFIRHALVEGEWDMSRLDKRLTQFVRDNARLRRELEQLEERQRRRDILLDDERLVEFFEQRIPDDVTDVRRFERWWRDARREHPELLTLQRADLIEADEPEVDDHAYPTRLTLGDQTLTVGYRFEPGAADDGVTVTVPLPLLPRLDTAGFDWLVPGLRLELVTALLKTLPKAIRRNVVPAADWAARLLAAVPPGADLRELSITEFLATEIRRQTFTPVDPDDFDLDRLPPHLRMGYAVVDERGSKLARGTDLTALQQKLRERTRDSVAKVASAAAKSPIERGGITVWDDTIGTGSGGDGGAGGTLPRQLDMRRGETTIRAYPALVDEGGSVAIRLQTSVADQVAAHRAGVRRLVQLGVPSPLAYIQEHLTSAEKLSLGASPYRSTAALIDDSLRAVIDAELSDGPDALPWSREQFESLRDRVNAGLPDRLFGIVATTAAVLAAAREVDVLIGRSSSLQLMAPLADAREQLNALVHDGFIGRTGLARLPRLVVYLRGISHRVERLADNLGRDRAWMLEVQQAVELYTAAGGTLPVAADPEPRIREARWMLEELRLSLFAQPLGAQGPISVQRIRKQLSA